MVFHPALPYFEMNIRNEEKSREFRLQNFEISSFAGEWNPRNDTKLSRDNVSTRCLFEPVRREVTEERRTRWRYRGKRIRDKCPASERVP